MPARSHLLPSEGQGGADTKPAHLQHTRGLALDHCLLVSKNQRHQGTIPHTLPSTSGTQTQRPSPRLGNEAWTTT